MSDPTTQILNHLTTQKNLTPSPSWLNPFLSTQRPTTPLNALVQTAHFRLLASDITTSLSRNASGCLPTDVGDVNVKERRLGGSIVVQVLDVEDVGRSRWEQVEAIEALERGEGTKGREIVRVTAAAEDGDGGGGGGKGFGPHKLLLQDAAGTRVYGFEEGSVEGVGVGMSIGCKMLLKGVVVRRGMVMLGSGVSLMGGKIEGLHATWRERRKRELRERIEREERVGV